MKKLLKVISLFSLFTIFLGCAGAGDYSIDLPGGYSIVRTSAHQISIAPKKGENSWGQNVIPAKIVEVGWNEVYIVAKQVGLKREPSKNNSLIPGDELSYWIIELGSNKIYGPLDDEEFLNKKTKLNISDDLILKSVNDVRFNR